MKNRNIKWSFPFGWLLCLVLILSVHPSSVHAQEVTAPEKVMSGDDGGMIVGLGPGEVMYGRPFESTGEIAFYLEYHIATSKPGAYTDPENKGPYMLTSYEYYNPELRDWEPREVYNQNLYVEHRYTFTPSPHQDPSKNGLYRFVISNPEKEALTFLYTEFEYWKWE